MRIRNFNKNALMVIFAFALVNLYSCKEIKKGDKGENHDTKTMEENKSYFKLSLAQWSIHRMIKEEGMDPYQFAAKAKEWGFEGLEYVSQLYKDELEKDNFSETSMKTFVDKCNMEAQKNGMKNLLIMIDGQGDLAAADHTERKQAVENHFKWVDAAAAMSCHSIRVNLNGSDDHSEWHKASVDGLTQLATYAKSKNINVLVENHGGFSSNGTFLADVMSEVGMDNCGTLPDFGNFCIKKQRLQEGGVECLERYDYYKGVTELMPYAKAVSAKSYDFDSEGNETKIDYAKMMKIVKDAGYSGYVGVEYEGKRLGEEQGILATKELLLKLVE